MLNSFIRTVILLVTVIFALRLMGKRQIAQLQPAELVVTILLSQIAATPMQDNDIPMINTFISILVLVGTEILLSAAGLKSGRLRELMQGNPVILIRDGEIDQKQMRRLRYSLDDVLETLRQKDVFSISDVQYAIAETNGNISVLLKPEKRTASAEDVNAAADDAGLECAVIMDGRVISGGLSECGISEKKLEKIIKEAGLSKEEIFLLTVDRNGRVLAVRKDEKR